MRTASTHDNALQVAEEVRGVLARAGREAPDRLAEAILGAQSVFCSGQGRSGLMIKAFAMRLVHLGLNVHVVGETTTPAIDRGDLLLAASGSGQTRTTLAIVEAARDRGASIAVLTAHPDSPVGRVADLVVELPAPILATPDPCESVQPPGSLFEQALLLCCDAMVVTLMERLGTTEAEMRARHTKLE